MPQLTKLAAQPHVTFVPIGDKDKALAFYRDQLGLTFVEDQSPFALVFDLSGTVLRATFAGDFKPQKFTILGWRVADIEAVAKELQSAGVSFNRYPGMNDQHPYAIWTAPGGTQVAWFTDPFGNVLSLQQDPA
ncbi:MAG TPA: VOC family protein [Acidobacteriaceae bacterium]|jgi:catechol 2,3-dioxygenase-like lactoylglutathione lyase family enzyme|nr:VOC family protein [Acidobacteriaceae bacterium]